MFSFYCFSFILWGRGDNFQDLTIRQKSTIGNAFKLFKINLTEILWIISGGGVIVFRILNKRALDAFKLFKINLTEMM